jgi:hypothetical protein
VRAIAAVLVTVFAISGTSGSPPSDKPPSVKLRQSDWEISDWTEVRRGQAGVMHALSGDSLTMYLLSTSRRAAGGVRFRSRTPTFAGNHYLVSSLDQGVQNRLGGYFSPFLSPPSSATTTIRRWEDGRRALTLDFLRAGSGYCGMWVHLFDLKRGFDERVYLDSSPFNFLSFWVRGGQGNERILLKLSDASWERREDALPIGEIAGFLPGKTLARTWQPAVIPLKHLPPGLNRHELAALVFEVSGAGQGRVAIKDLAFCVDQSPAPLSPPSVLPKNSVKTERAVWVWNTKDILSSPEQQREVVSFSREMGISHLYLQLPNELLNLRISGGIQVEAAKWRPFLELLNSSGLDPSALDGFKDYALPDWHERVLQTVDNVIAFNRSVESRQRFRGIHYDIEPYLLEGYLGPRRRRILQGYLQLIERIAARVGPAGLVFGVDIPFWYDSADDLSGRPFRLEFNGRNKLPSEHVIDLVDQVSLMDYRTSAYGADGVIAQAQGELTYATEQGKRVFVGLETANLPDEELLDFEGSPSHGLPDSPPSSRCILVIPGSPQSTVYLVSAAQWDGMRKVLESTGRDPQSVIWWPVKKVTPVNSHRLTFAGLGIDRLDQTMAETQDELMRFPSFAGFAIHDYLGLRRLLGLEP